MIKPRNLIILAAVLVILIGVSLLQKAKHEENTGSAATAVVLAGQFTPEQLSQLSLGFKGETEQLVLKKGPQGWVIETMFNAKVNDQRLSTLLRNFSDVVGEFRSDSEKVLQDYGLRDDQAVTLRGYDDAGVEVMALNLGNTPEGFPGQFIRQPDSNKVYLSQIPLLSHLGIYAAAEAPKAQFFLELQAVKDDRLGVDGFTVFDGEQSHVFRKEFATIEPATGAPEGSEPALDRNTWEWTLNGSAALDLAKTKIDGVFNSAVSIRANDVADPAMVGQYGFAASARRVTLLRQDGTEMVLEFGADREAAGTVGAGTYLRIDGGNTIWVVTDYTVNNLFKSHEELKAE